jgi:hypothetical protein
VLSARLRSKTLAMSLSKPGCGLAPAPDDKIKQAIKEFDIRPEDRKATMCERKTRLLAAGNVSGVPPAAF